jgi:hypothetical protein
LYKYENYISEKLPFFTDRRNIDINEPMVEEFITKVGVMYGKMNASERDDVLTTLQRMLITYMQYCLGK